MQDKEQSLYKRLDEQSMILERRKREREEQERAGFIKKLERVTKKIEDAVELHKPVVLISEDEYVEELHSFFKIQKVERGNPLDHEEPSTTYVVDLE